MDKAVLILYTTFAATCLYFAYERNENEQTLNRAIIESLKTGADCEHN